MANCTSDFKKFGKLISLTPSDRKQLRAARTAIVKKIKTYFKANSNCPQVEFIPQGSFTMGTIIRPTSGEYDIDIGVYLRGYSDWQRDWPKPETASMWLYNALKDHTSTLPVNKRTCIRVVYQPPARNKKVGYHVDLPIYIDYTNLVGTKYTRIGINGDIQWSEKSDPVGFTNWLSEKCALNSKDKNQLIRLVKYAKAWKDKMSSVTKFPSGIALTVLLAENFSPHERDDYAFYDTMRKSYNSLNGLFSIQAIAKPVEPGNDLLDRLTDVQKKKFVQLLGVLVDDAELAVTENNQFKAISYWQNHFGARFAQVAARVTAKVQLS
jgi:hypothetical protein